MELCPGEDESQLAAAEVAVHDLQVVDSHLCFSFGMASMEVREAVIVEEHDDGYPKEAADRRHFLIMPTASAVRVQTKPFASMALGHLGHATERQWDPGYEGDTDADLAGCWSQVNPVSPIADNSIRSICHPHLIARSVPRLWV